jgi:hypothetical protein
MTEMRRFGAKVLTAKNKTATIFISIFYNKEKKV